MNDAQRDHLAQMLGPINAQADKNKLELAYEEVKQRLDTFIEQQRIKPEDLPGRQIRKVVTDYNSMTIITRSGQYVHVSAEPGYRDGVDFCTSDTPDIEDARDMGILSKEQYDEYKDAQQAYLRQRRKINTRDRLERLVREAGAGNVQEYLNELNQ